MRELSVAFQTDKRPNEYRELAQLSEGYGFDVLSMYSDLTFQPPVVPLALAALETERIRLGPASLNPFTLHPVEIAGQIATLDMVSNGRAYLGLSRGAWLDTIGVEQHRPISRVTDTLRAVNHLLSRGSTKFQGETLTLRPSVRLRYQPQRSSVPMMVGTWGRKLIQTCLPLVDEIKLGGSANPDMVRVARSWLAGRDIESPPGIVLGAVTIVDEDGDAARDAIKREMTLYLPVVAPLDPTVAVDPEMLARINWLVQENRVDEATRQIPDDLVNRFSFSGTPRDIIDQCEMLFDAGASRIEFGTPHGLSTRNGLRLLGEIVLPALRDD